METHRHYFAVAGALDQDLRIGDRILATEVLQHDSVFSGDANVFMAPGKPYVSVPATERASPIFVTDRGFNAWIKATYPDVKSGCVLTGNEFVGSAARKNALRQLIGDARAVEMEAAGVAVIAERLGIPFGVVKTIADRLNPDLSVSHDYTAFITRASETAALTVGKLWDLWSANQRAVARKKNSVP